MARRKRLTLSRGAQLLVEWRGEMQQVDIASQLAIAPETYNRFERGARKPNLKYATKIEQLTRGRVPTWSWLEPAVEGKAS